MNKYIFGAFLVGLLTIANDISSVDGLLIKRQDEVALTEAPPAETEAPPTDEAPLPPPEVNEPPPPPPPETEAPPPPPETEAPPPPPETEAPPPPPETEAPPPAPDTEAPPPAPDTEAPAVTEAPPPPPAVTNAPAEGGSSWWSWIDSAAAQTLNLVNKITPLNKEWMGGNKEGLKPLEGPGPVVDPLAPQPTEK